MIFQASSDYKGERWKEYCKMQVDVWVDVRLGFGWRNVVEGIKAMGKGIGNSICMPLLRH
jgi:hypothetical protein